MSLQVGFFPRDRMKAESVDSVIENVGISRSNMASGKKEKDQELEELLRLFCEPSPEKLPGS
ncbi:MAG: hypothetical protein JSS53_05945 [Proteobacteria bacterium]|nr:hypothetical protein [Pseudomonadota bacterium]